MPNDPVIELTDVSFAYDRAPVLEDVNVSIRRHESICVVGPNGGGKTTLLRLILGLLEPTAGRVRVLGQEPRRARRRIGYMPQHANYDPQFPVTAMDVVLMGRLGRGNALGWYGRADRHAAAEALDEVDMQSDADRSFAALSGGQRQRVLIARALCCGPELLLLDEPTANVDTAAENQLAELLQQLQRQMTIVMVSHDLGFVSDVVERVVCVNRRVVVHPTAELTGETIREMYDADVRMVRHDDVLCDGKGEDHDG